MPTTSSSDRYSAVSSSSASSSASSNSCYNNNNNHHYHQQRQQPPPPPSNQPSYSSSSSQSSTTFLPLRSATSSFHLSKLNSANYRSMQSLKTQQQQQPQQFRTDPAPVARISPRIINQAFQLNEPEKNMYQHDDGWLSCDELETIERRFTDLLQEPTYKKSILSIYDQQQHESRAKSCDRLTIDDEIYRSTTPAKHIDDGLSVVNEFTTRKPLLSQVEENDMHEHAPLPASLIYDNNLRSRSQTPHPLLHPSPRTVLTANDILKVESSYRSIGTQVFACRCLCELYITTAERLAKLEDWMLFQHGLPVWLLNSGNNTKRPSRLSLIVAEHGSGFPIWQDTIDGQSDVKQARAQHITFRLSDRNTLAVLRFHDLAASREFFSYYHTIRNDHRFQHLFSSNSSRAHNRSLSCGSKLRNRRKHPKNINKSSISNPCQFQHITSLQAKDRTRLISLEQCLLPSQNYSNFHI